MNVYLVWRYNKQGHSYRENNKTWGGCGFWGRISDEAIYPVWQVRALSLREAVRQTSAEWRRRHPEIQRYGGFEHPITGCQCGLCKEAQRVIQ